MGTFRVEVTLKNIHESARRQTLSLLVDTGATYTTLPRTVAESLGCSPIGTRRVLLANGREEEWPIGLVMMTLENQELPTVCLIGPNGGPALLGAVTLEEFALSVDPVAKRLVPVRLSDLILYDMRSAVTIRLDPDLEKLLDRLCKQTGRTRSELVRDALRRQLSLLRFERLRRRALPFAEARGYLRDEDVARDVS